MATIAHAIRLALRYAETELGLTDVFGQDVGPPLGGVFTLTRDLESAWSTPLDERGIVGTAAGQAMIGAGPVVCEIQFGDYLLNTIDLLRLIGNTCWSTAGQFPMPLVLMTPVGGGIHGGIYHSHSVESELCRLPGWRVVMPTTAPDAFGLLVSALLDGNPVAYLVPKALIRRPGERLPGEPDDLRPRLEPPGGQRLEGWTPDWPDTLAPFAVPIGPPRVARRGSDLTVLTWGRMVSEVLQAAPDDGRVEVLDLRTLAPLDTDAIAESVGRTGQLLVVTEDRARISLGEHVLRVVQERAAPRVARLLAGRDVPGIGLSQALEDYALPTAGDLRAAIKALL